MLSYIEGLKAILDSGGLENESSLGPFGSLLKPDYQGISSAPRKASVLLLIYPNNGELKLCLIKRPDYEGVHGGQIAAPGGKLEESESDLQAAKRETQEEIGVSADKYEVLGSLGSIYIPPSNFLVKPFLAYADKKPEMVPEEKEVAEILEIPLHIFKGYDLVSRVKFPLRGLTFNVPAFLYEGHIIWGATARILAEFTAINMQIIGQNDVKI